MSYLNEYVCPICNNVFYAAPMHIYKRYIKKYHSEKLICSWSCCSKYDNEVEAEAKRKKELTEQKRKKYKDEYNKKYREHAKEYQRRKREKMKGEVKS